MPQAILAKAFRGELVGQEVKEYVREVEELGMVAEGVKTFEVSKTSKVWLANQEQKIRKYGVWTWDS